MVDLQMTHPLVNIRKSIAESAPTNEVDNYKKEIVDLFRDYRHPWDIFTELLQNSVDAINGNAKLPRGSIVIEIDKLQRLIRIRDNGTGISKDNLQKVLVPNVSIDKDAQRTYGYKGVGLSFVAHLTKSISVVSVCNGIYAKYTILNSFPWVIGRTAEPVSEELVQPQSSFQDSFTEIVIHLDGNYSDSGLRTLQGLDYIFDWASNAKIVEFILRTRTVIGNTKIYLGKSPEKVIDVSLIVNGVTCVVPYKLLTPFDCAYTKTSKYFLTKAFDGKPAYEYIYLDSQKPDSLKGFKCLRHDFADQEVGTRVKTKFDVSILCCGETSVSKLQEEFDVINICPIYDALDLGTGIFLSINGMPTGIKLHQWTDGFNKRFYCVVDVSMDTNSELDKGRKGISEHTKKLIIEKIEVLLSDKFIGGRYSIRHLGHRMQDVLTRGYAGSDFKTHLDKWDATPNAIQGFGIQKAPLDENGVIAIFFEVIGKDKLTGFKIRYISQDASFDFAFEYFFDVSRFGSCLGLTQSHFDSLGYDPSQNGGKRKNALGNDYFVGEFKVSVEEVVNKGHQPLQNLDLLVAWDFDQAAIDRKGGGLTDCPDDARNFEGVTHILTDNSGSCQVILLKELLQRHSFLLTPNSASAIPLP